MRTPSQKFGTHLARRLLESYDNSDAEVRGAQISLEEADTYIEKLEAIVQSIRDGGTVWTTDEKIGALDRYISSRQGEGEG